MSTSSPELFVELDRSRPRGLRAQLERSLRDAIRAGRLRPGVRLPSSRALAADLQVTRGVVIAAYHQLVAEGYLTSRQGWGTVVNAITMPEGSPRHRTPPAAIRYDFRPGDPDVGLFPHAAWARATRAAMRSHPTCPSAIATRPVSQCCARRWPTTWAGSGACPANRTTSWCATVSRTG